jgi:hypothetical protein
LEGFGSSKSTFFLLGWLFGIGFGWRIALKREDETIVAFSSFANKHKRWGYSYSPIAGIPRGFGALSRIGWGFYPSRPMSGWRTFLSRVGGQACLARTIRTIQTTKLWPPSLC